LVGHSTGGVIARICAANEPDRVAGLVLVDSSHEHQMRLLGQVEWRAGKLGMLAYAAEWARCPAGVRRLAHDVTGRRALRREISGQVPADLVKASVARALSSAGRRADVQEKLGAAFGMPAVPASTRELGDLPLTVLSAGPQDKGPGQRIWDELQASFLTMSTRARQVVVADSGHHINREKPAAVAEAIVAMLDQAQSSDAARRQEALTTDTVHRPAIVDVVPGGPGGSGAP
jgi:pimeloyl-ACP methyl ester carboxylesterase